MSQDNGYTCFQLVLHLIYLIIIKVLILVNLGI